MGEAWIIDAVRTPRGKGRKDVGALVHTHPQELLATTLRALAARNGIDLGCRTFLSCISKGFGGFCSRLLRLRTGKLSSAFRLHGVANIF
jgi:acetyl-CoA acetyltransferase